MESGAETHPNRQQFDSNSTAIRQQFDSIHFGKWGGNASKSTASTLESGAETHTNRQQIDSKSTANRQQIDSKSTSNINPLIYFIFSLEEINNRAAHAGNARYL